jgi:trimeric autotransporter adhesin
MVRVGLVAGMATALVGWAAAAAFATTPGWECIPVTAGQAVVSGGTGSTPACAAGSTAVLAPTFVSSGVGGKPTVQFSGVNVQVISGTGSTSGAVNGEGNLVVGYAENTSGRTRTGSNDLVVGSESGWKSYGEIVGGFGNTAGGTYASAFGTANAANGAFSLVAGQSNRATGSASSVTGGKSNTAKAVASSILGGDGNTASANCQAIPAAPGTC